MNARKSEIVRIFIFFIGIAFFAALIAIPLIFFERDIIKNNDATRFVELAFVAREKLFLGDRIAYLDGVFSDRLYKINRNSKLAGYVMFSTIKLRVGIISIISLFDKDSIVLSVIVPDSKIAGAAGNPSFRQIAAEKLVGLGGQSSIPLEVSSFQNEKADAFSGATETWEEIFKILNRGQDMISSLKEK